MNIMDLLLMILSSLVMLIGVLISVAFLTLLERKVLGYIQFRKGPNKLGIVGLLQPFSDAIKLFSKEFFTPEYSNYLIYLFSPIFSLFVSLLVWLVMPYMFGNIYFYLGFIFIFCCLSMGVYLIMMSGWSSNSNYSMIGGMRAIAQTISYEVSLIIMMLSVIILIGDYNLMNLVNYQNMVWFIVFMMPISLIFFSSLLAECNRTPFDFAEGESELVSGFNIEYGGSEFALVFLSEYSSILFMSTLFSMMFLGGNVDSFMFYIKVMLLSFMFIWVRGTLPRYRYDKLMYLTWKVYLTVSLSVLLLMINLMMLLLI
uniref:NADH-ubiquinone oxidoreductase chain 1 n=1 Tax=Maesaipsyche stengeli TaxID=2904894 RepID=A0A9E8LNK4_9NEOP|nr:NADH dehydrogenase subunit 1 [Maesaipsyche stengeli]UZZ43661.1 NADH dehydrogenase subunit 1 [Maesaipsyche stengeli]